MKPARLEEDLVLLFTAIASASSEDVLRRMGKAGYGDLRPSHGYVFQHLIPGPVKVRELAARLGITAQGASKAVTELEELGYVRRRVAEDDQRNRLVELTERGWAAVEAGRAARAAVNRRLRTLLGEEQAGALLAALQRIADRAGGMELLSSRRLRQPH
ncbi:MarR family winged helix-turn-helix transcriptional regulator [Sorangium sp. So ce131]|uniref:MarR family winged helix-turn-helix transcriptional regulator n=1 Tax=Sorangium sp. So ce131 TaxID=3133282 RepID=UPI003F5D7D3B